MSYYCHHSGVCCQIDKTVSPQELGEMLLAGPMYQPLNCHTEGDLVRMVGPCPFYLDGCTIYAKRPAVCRSYLCYRKNAADPHRSIPEQIDFMNRNPDAVEQAQTMREKAMGYAREHGWSNV